MDEKGRTVIPTIKKYPVLFIIIFIIILFCSGYLIMNYSITGLFGEAKKTNEISFKTEYGDNFIIVEKSFYFPQPEYYVEVYSEKVKNKNFVAKIFKEYKEQSINLISIYKSEDIRCYSLLSEILYKEKSMGKFKSINMKAFPNIKIDEYLMFVPVAKQLMKKNDWKWINVFCEFLVKTRDDYTIKLLQRYSKDDFFDDEIKKNKDSGYTKDEIQKFSNELIKKYNLQ